eukprot:4154999-Alexandrium_andersonii.AAC.1
MDWLHLVTNLQHQNEEHVATILTSSQSLATGLAQSMSKVLRDIVTHQRQEGPVTHVGKDSHTWNPNAWDCK